MTMTDYEIEIMRNVLAQYKASTTRDEINKIYRQARTWNRFHHFFGSGCTYERYLQINNFFKTERWDRLKELGV